MNLNASDCQILGFQVIRLSGGIAESDGVPDQDFVSLDQVGNKILRWSGSGGEFRDGRPFCQSLKTARSKGIEGANALGDIIHRGEELFVLGLKGSVQLEEVFSLHIPMGEMGLRQEGIGIGKQGLKARDDLRRGGF